VVDDDKETAADGDAEEADKEEAADAAAGDAAPSWMLRHRASEPLVGSALPPSRIAGLGVAAAVAVLKSRRPLAALRDVSGALPTLARHLSRLSLKSPANAPLVEALAARWPLLNSARGARRHRPSCPAPLLPCPSCRAPLLRRAVASAPHRPPLCRTVASQRPVAVAQARCS